MIAKLTISRDDSIYEAWPDVALTSNGRLVCVFSECRHHWDRSYTRIVACHSDDRGHTWSAKRPVTEGTTGHPYYNCPRITALRDGRLAIAVDKLFASERSASLDDCHNLLIFSEDGGLTWSMPIETPVRGIVPDKLLELESGRWILAAHYEDRAASRVAQSMWYSDDSGTTWSDPVIIAEEPALNLCEVTILPIDASTLVAFHRENSGDGQDCYKAISRDNGETWGHVIRFPLPGCHRPVAGFLEDGRILITYRFMHGGKGWLGTWTQNLFAALTDKESALAPDRNGAWTRILPVDFDRSPQSDLGYSGWVQFDDGEIFIVSYIVDDAPKAQIRGYSLDPAEFLLQDCTAR